MRSLTDPVRLAPALDEKLSDLGLVVRMVLDPIEPLAEALQKVKSFVAVVR
jgi:hypothetical protein